MHTNIDFAAINHIFFNALKQERSYLFEHEVYELLNFSGAETTPRTVLVSRGAAVSQEEISLFHGDKIVLKIVSPTIVHKTEARGVRIIERTPEKVRATVRRMFYEVPEAFSTVLEKYPHYRPESYVGLQGEDLVYAIQNDIRAVMLTQYIPPDSQAFGNELIVGLRHSDEFGSIISAGLGGTDTELYAKRFKKGQAIVAASVEMVDGEIFFQQFRKTISYQKLAGLTRGSGRIVSDEQLIECFSSFIELGRYYSANNSESPFTIDELEINPFAFTDFQMIPLDGLCHFSLSTQETPKRPLKKIHNLLHPERIGIVGVSAGRVNFGRIILDNIITAGFPKENITIFHEHAPAIADIACLNNLNLLTQPLDLLVLAVAAEYVPSLVRTIVENNSAHAVMLIASNMGETKGSLERAEGVKQDIMSGRATVDGGPIFLGANCMGVVSHPGKYDTWFIPKEKFTPPYMPQRKIEAEDGSNVYQRSALISQSGAFMLHRLSQMPSLNPAYMVSMGNQSDLTLGDMLDYFSKSDEVDVIAVYAEGFNFGDGLAFIKAVRKAVCAGKIVVFYKAGRTEEGKHATSGHTASLAGDYMVCESCVREAGAIVTRTFTEFQNVFMLAVHLHHTSINGRRLAACSGAGFEAVGMADSIQADEYSMSLCQFSPECAQKIHAILQENYLDSIVTVQNPLDISPSANDKMHVEIIKVLLEDRGNDAVVMSFGPLSPSTHTLPHSEMPLNIADPQSMVHCLENMFKDMPKHRVKPLIGIVDGGSLFHTYRQALMKLDIPIYTVCDEAIAALALYMEARIKISAYMQTPSSCRF